MADWSLPSLSSAYSDFLTYLKNRDTDAITLCVSAPTNPVTGTIKYVRASDKLQEYNGATWDDKVLSIAGGGTGAATASAARTALGIGSLGTQNSNSVSISGGTISGVSLAAGDINSGTLALARGGTGASLTLGASGTFLRSSGSAVAFSSISISDLAAGDYSAKVTSGNYSINVTGSSGSCTGNAGTSDYSTTSGMADYATTAGDADYAIEAGEVNGSQTGITGVGILTGLSVDGNAEISGKISPSADNSGSIGASGTRWNDIYVVNTHVGDVVFENGWRITESYKAGIFEPGLAITNELGETVLFISRTGLKEYRNGHPI